MRKDGWAIDMSTGTPILTYDGCSVIQDEQAHEIIKLLADHARLSAPPPLPEEVENALFDIDKLNSGCMTVCLSRGQYSIIRSHLTAQAQRVEELAADVVRERECRVAAEATLERVMENVRGNCEMCGTFECEHHGAALRLIECQNWTMPAAWAKGE